MYLMEDKKHLENQGFLPKPSEINLNIRTMGLIAILVTIIVSSVVGISIVNTQKIREEALLTRSELISKVQVEAISNLLWDIDMHQIARQMHAITKDPEIKGAVVYDKNNIMVGKAGIIFAEEDDILVEQEILYEEDDKQLVIGKLVLLVSKELLHSTMWDHFIMNLLALGLLLISILGSIYFILRTEVAKISFWYGEKTRQLSLTLKELQHSNVRVEQANRKLQEESDLIRLMEEITVSVNNVETVEDAFRLCIERICHHMHWPVAHVYEYDESSEHIQSSKIWYCKDYDTFAPFIKETEQTPLKPGEGLASEVRSKVRIIWVENLQHCPSFCRKEIAEQVGLTSGVAFPVLIRSEVAAVIEFYTTNTLKEDDQLRYILMNIGTQLARAIERKRSEHMLLESKKNLEIKVKKRTKELLAAKEEAEKANRTKSEFLANMSHELRTPLNSLLILAELLAENKQKNLTKDQVECAHIIYDSGSDLLMLINDILDLSKVESGNLPINLSVGSLDSVVASLHKTFGHLTEHQDIQLNILQDEAAPGHLYTDLPRVGQILKNLMSNAVKFTEPGGEVSLHIYCPDNTEVSTLEREYSDNQVVAFAVKDTGIGIPEDKYDMIFEAFQQAESNISAQYGGTGLGLSICQKLAYILGGEITLQSKVGEGSVFTLYLPLNAEYHDLDGIVVAEHRKAEIHKPVSSASEDTLNHRPLEHVLLVDDDQHNNYALSKMLEDKGVDVYMAASGREAMDVLSEHPETDLVLMDIMMPGMDGYEAIDKIHAMEKFRNLPIIAITANAMESDRNKCLSAGASDYLTKPVDKEQLFSILGHFFRTR